MPPYRMTTWYFAITASGEAIRMPQRLGEALLVGERPIDVPDRFQRDPGGVLYAGVVIVKDDGAPVAVERCTVRCVNVGGAERAVVATGPWVWGSFARAIAVRAKSDASLARAGGLGVFLDHMERGKMPIEVARMMGNSTAASAEDTWLYNWRQATKVQNFWDLRRGGLVEGCATVEELLAGPLVDAPWLDRPADPPLPTRAAVEQGCPITLAQVETLASSPHALVREEGFLLLGLVRTAADAPAAREHRPATDRQGGG